MLLIYSFLYSFGMLLMSPLFLLRRQKYASGFSERLGNYPEFKQDERKVIWLHCVSVGETNAARPLVDDLARQFPLYRLIISTTTRTGQELAKKIFRNKADAVFYIPFDWKFSVRRALRQFRPSLILLMETEIWPRLIIEAKKSGSKVVIVNGRLSASSFERYLRVRNFVRRVLKNVDIALMQNPRDAERIRSLGMQAEKVFVTGNLKFDLSAQERDTELTEKLRRRFRRHGVRPLIIAASTHAPEERIILKSLENILPHQAKLFIVPRHPDRFDEVYELLEKTPYRIARRSEPETERDPSSDVVLIDSMGELRAVYPLADLVIVGGSLIPHGGQSILEPAVHGKAIVIGPYTENFADAVGEFLAGGALIQLPRANEETILVELSKTVDKLIMDPDERSRLGSRALSVIERNRGATAETIRRLAELL